MKNFYKLILSVEDIGELSSTVEIEKGMLQSVTKEIIESYCSEYKCSEDDIKIKSIFEISLNNKVSLDYLKQERFSYKGGTENEVFNIDSLDFIYKDKTIEVIGFSGGHTIDETLCVILDSKKTKKSIKFLTFVQLIEEQEALDIEKFLQNTSQEKDSINDLLGELDNSINDYKENHQSKAEKEVIQFIEDYKESLIETEKKDIETVENMYSLIQNEKSFLSQSLYGILEGLPKEYLRNYQLRVKDIIKKYLEFLPGDNNVSHTTAEQIRDKVLNRLYIEQGLDKKLQIKSAYKLFNPMERDYDGADLKDVKTWFNELEINGPINKEDDFRVVNVKFNYDYVLNECINSMGKLEDITNKHTKNAVLSLIGYFVESERSFKDVIYEYGKEKAVAFFQENLGTTISGNTIKLKNLTGLYTNFQNKTSFTNGYNHLDIFHRLFTAIIEGKELGEIPLIEFNNIDDLSYTKFLGVKNETSENQKWNSWLISFTPYKNGNLNLNIRPELMLKLKPFLMNILDIYIDEYRKK